MRPIAAFAAVLAAVVSLSAAAPAQSGDGRDVLVVRRDAPPNLRYGARLAMFFTRLAPFTPDELVEAVAKVIEKEGKP